MIIRKSGCRILVLLIITAFNSTAAPRQWTNTAGKEITAEFISSDGADVTLLMNGKEIKYPLEKLSQSDRDFVAEQAKKPNVIKVAAETGWMDNITIDKPAFSDPKEYLSSSNAKAMYKAFASGNFPNTWTANKGTAEEMFSYENGTMIVYVPPTYDPTKPMGVYLHVSPGDNGDSLQNYTPIMDRTSMIYISPKGTSNNQPMLRRVKLAVDALATVKERWKIDENRVCIGGLSGGGHIAMMTHAMFPQWFGASISHAAQSYLPQNGSVGHFPGLEVRDITGKDCKDHRWVVISGDKDFNYQEILKTSDQWKSARADYKFFDVPGMGHANAPPENFAQALTWAMGD